jgi:hypothetical protein
MAAACAAAAPSPLMHPGLWMHAHMHHPGAFSAMHMPPMPPYPYGAPPPALCDAES